MASGLRLDASRAFRRLERDLSDFERRQVPFAAAQTLNKLAKEITVAETALIGATFDKPTPFTRRAMFIPRRAAKTSLMVTVDVRPIQAAYLEPYLGRGMQVLGKSRGILLPVDIARNAYGNIPKGKLAALKGSGQVFVGPVKTKTGRVIFGVWKRVNPNSKLGRQRRGGGAVQTRHLQLLVEFSDPRAVKPRLAYFPTAERILDRRLAPLFWQSLSHAMATAR